MAEEGLPHGDRAMTYMPIRFAVDERSPKQQKALSRRYRVRLSQQVF